MASMPMRLYCRAMNFMKSSISARIRSCRNGLRWSGLAVICGDDQRPRCRRMRCETAISMHPVQITAAALGTLVGFVVYLFLHEGVHGMCIRWFSGVPAQYGFRAAEQGMAYAGSRFFFSQERRTLIIALAPIVVWGTVLDPAAARYARRQYWWYLYADPDLQCQRRGRGSVCDLSHFDDAKRCAGSGYRHGDEIFRADAFCLKRIEAGSPLALDNG